MREVIPEQLWIGNAIDSRDVKSVLDMGVTAIIDLAMEETPISFPRDVVYCRFPLVDGSGNSPVILRTLIQTTTHFIRETIPTLIACGAGMSRAPAIVAAAMTLVEETTFDKALRKITVNQPHDVSPSLLGEIIPVLERLRE